MAATDIADLLELGQAGFGQNGAGAIAPNNNTGVVLKAGPGILFDIYASNLSTVSAYVKVYNQTTAPASTDTPALRFQIPPVASGGELNISSRCGYFFSTGISYRVTTGIADNDTASPAATTYLVNFGWK